MRRVASMVDDGRMSYPHPPPQRDPHTRGIKWGVWILVIVFVGIPVLVCCVVPLIMGLLGAVGLSINQPHPTP